MLRLRPYKECDAEKIATWIKDEKSFYLWSAGKLGKYPLSKEKLISYYEEYKNDTDFWVMSAVEESGELVGQFIMRYVDGEKNTIRLGFIIVDSEKRGHGYGREMLLLAKEYAFNLLHVESITLGVFINNPAAVRCYENIGFKGIDRIDIYRILDEDWECLEMKMDRD